MSLSDRVTRLEDAYVRVSELIEEQTAVLRDHGQLLRDIISLLNAQGDRLDRIERAIRERGHNGTAL